MSDDQLSLGDYLAIIRRRWLTVLGVLLLLVFLAVVWSLLQTPRYASTATVLVGTGSAAEVLDPVTGQARGSRLMINESRFAESDRVREFVEQELTTTHGVTKLEDNYGVGVSASNDSDELRFRGTATNANAAALAAQVWANAYIDLRRETTVAEYGATIEVISQRESEIEAELDALLETDLERRRVLEKQLESLATTLDELQVTSQLGGSAAQVIRRPVPAAGPYAPQTSRNVFLGAIVGMLLGIGAALLLESLDTSLSSKEDVEIATGGVSTLAIVPSLTDWRERSATRIVSIEEPQSQAAEAYRTLRAALEFATLDSNVRVLQLTSANPGEGKTTTAVNLAVALSRTGKKVILVDADLRKPRIHAFFDLSYEPGLTNAILGQKDLAELGTVVERQAGSVVVMTSGPLPPGPSELLGSTRTKRVFAELQKLCDLVIVDSPPVLPVSDALVLAKQVDGTLLVANGARTSAPELSRAVELLRQVDAKLVGTVLNQVSRSGNGYGYGYGGYGYGYGQDTSGAGSGSGSKGRVSRPRRKAGRSG